MYIVISEKLGTIGKLDLSKSGLFFKLNMNTMQHQGTVT